MLAELSQSPQASAPAPLTSPSPSTSTQAQAQAPAPPSTVATSISSNSLGQERKSSHSGANGLQARSCVTCRRRKVKCDKQVPSCANCAKTHTQCVFPAPGRAPRRPRQGKVVTEREAELLKRLRRLEGVVEELSGQVEVEGPKHSPGSDRSSVPKDVDSNSESNKANGVRVVGMDEGSGTKTAWMARTFNLGAGPPKTAFDMNANETAMGRLVLDEGKSSYVANPFWASLSEEVEEIRDILEAEPDYDTDEESRPILPTDVVTNSNHQSFVMGYASSDIDLKSLHPLPSQIPFYWQTFLENVEPLVKILHTQTMNKFIKEVQHNLDSLSRSTEALMFSIYFATITSMTGEEVKTNFGIEKDYLLKQYRFGVEQALARAGFLNTNEIVTVQALVLFLLCVRRHDDSRFVWTLTGLAIRIAQSLGMHRDGTKFGLSPFDTEMRRRLWWQILVLDIRASEDHGSESSILDQSFDTEFPLSIDDSDLDPDAIEAPTPRIGVSEMTFCLIRYEICTLTRKLNYFPLGQTSEQRAAQATIEERELMVKETADRLEEKYLKYCDNAGALCWVAATVARLTTAKMSLILYQPLIQFGRPNTLPQCIKDHLLMCAIQVIEYSRVMESESKTKKWRWLFHTYIQWNAVAYILGELCIRSQSMIVDRAWRAVDGVFKELGVVLSQSKDKIGIQWRPMRVLMAKARRKREENMQTQVQQGAISGDLGMDRKYIRPPPSGLGIPPRDTFYSPTRTITDVTNDQYTSPTKKASNLFISYQQQNYVHDIPMSEPQAQPQAIGMAPMLALDQIQLQLQQQMQQNSWLTEDSSLLGLDMAGLEGEANWDDMVRDFQMEIDNGSMGENRGPGLGGMGNWW